MMIGNNICRVCGLFQESPPWGEDGDTPSFEICACCGVEFGNDDSTIVAIHRTRKEWLNKGAKWFISKFKPLNWNLAQQLSQIPIDFS